MRDHCAQCLIPILGFGHETPKREVLCGPCYSAIWGPRGEREMAADGSGGERGERRGLRRLRRG